MSSSTLRDRNVVQVEDVKPFTSKVGFFNPPTWKTAARNDSKNTSEGTSDSFLEPTLLHSSLQCPSPRTFFYPEVLALVNSSAVGHHTVHWRERELLRNNAVSVTFAGELLPPSGEGPLTVEVREWYNTDKGASRRSRNIIRMWSALSHPFIIQCYGYQLGAACTSENRFASGSGSACGASLGLSLGGSGEGGGTHGMAASSSASVHLRNSATLSEYEKSIFPSSVPSSHGATSTAAAITAALPVFRYRLELFFELCGPTVAQWLLSHPQGLSIFLVREITRQLLEALSYLHLRGVLHGDVNPENIVFSFASSEPYTNESECLVKLADFSCSSSLVDEGWCKDFKGTFAFMAPEIFIGEKLYGSRVDVWALGCTVLALLGRPPWGKDVSCAPSLCIEVLQHPGCVPYGMPSRSQCPFMLFDFLQCCFQWDPDLRASVDTLLIHPWITAEKQSLIEISREENCANL